MEGRVKIYEIEITPAEKGLLMHVLSRFIKSDIKKELKVEKELQKDAEKLFGDFTRVD
jgi:hypothetical protein